MSGRSKLSTTDLIPGTLITPRFDVALSFLCDDLADWKPINVDAGDLLTVLNSWVTNDRLNVVCFFENVVVHTHVSVKRLGVFFDLVSRYTDCEETDMYYRGDDSFDKNRVDAGGSWPQTQETLSTSKTTRNPDKNRADLEF